MIIGNLYREKSVISISYAELRIMNLLLKNIFYGNELPRLEVGSEQLRKWLSKTWPKVEDGRPLEVGWASIYENTREYFRQARPGIFGGPITAGDGLAILAFMAALRPNSMIEVGVASGFSTAFILQSAKNMGLINLEEIFLHSLDIVAEHDNGDKTGQLLERAHPHLLSNWRLHAPATSLDLLTGSLSIPQHGSVLAFIDGGHTHPWPLADILAMYKLLPRGSWILMQDVQIMERWLADCVLYGAPSNKPVRGVQLAVSLWPGTKWIGHGICYNMAALKLDVDRTSVRQYVESALEYSDERDFPDRSILRDAVNL